MASITNVVVLMLENRSYDNVLGWLYGGRKDAPLNGLTGSESNTDSAGTVYKVTNAAPSTIGGSGQTYPATTVPMIDPQEPFGDMAQQYLGKAPDSATPWKDYGGDAPMSGFVDNYANAPNITPQNIGDVMTYLTPEQLPVTAFLAKQFGVCDAWFASVPTQTFTNRLFALCAAPQVIAGEKYAFDGSGDPNPILVPNDYSVVDDADHAIDPLHLAPESSVVDSASILSQLDLIQPAPGGPQWKIYFHDYSIALMTLPYASKAARASASQNNVSTFDDSDWGGSFPMQLAGVPGSTFVQDVQNGTLPPFSFIEPRYNMGLINIPFERHPNETLPPSANHPGAGNTTLLSLFTKKPPAPDPSNPPIDATGGELLLMQVYNLLRNSSYWDSTLLIVTYDEAGGIYDHVAPPPAVPVSVPAVQSPHQHDVAAENFGFNAFGGRVPAIIVSPYIASGSKAALSGTTFDHTSIIRTAWQVFNLGEGSLTERDAAAPSLMQFVDSSTVNDAPPFSGQIIASPSAVIVDTRGFSPPSRVLLASAGPGFTLTAAGSGESWFRVTPSGIQFAPDVYGWTVDIDKDALIGISGQTLTGTVTITASGETTLTRTVSVSLHVS